MFFLHISFRDQAKAAELLSEKDTKLRRVKIKGSALFHWHCGKPMIKVDSFSGGGCTAHNGEIMSRHRYCRGCQLLQKIL